MPDPISGVEGARLYRTGDNAFFHGDGNIEFVGRVGRHYVETYGEDSLQVRACRGGYHFEPSVAESVAVARDLALAEHTRAKIHFRSLSTHTAVRMLGEAQRAARAAALVRSPRSRRPLHC